MWPDEADEMDYIDKKADASSLKIEIPAGINNKMKQIDKMHDARWKRTDKMEREDHMKKWGYR